jgi:hypothetical protein
MWQIAPDVLLIVPLIVLVDLWEWLIAAQVPVIRNQGCVLLSVWESHCFSRKQFLL